jgi:hypothetical protein
LTLRIGDDRKWDSKLPDSLVEYLMAETNEPEKGTVRIELPPQQIGSSFGSDSGHGDTRQINIPPCTAPNNILSSSSALKPPNAPATPASRATVPPGLDQAPNGSSLAVPSIAEPIFSAVHSPSISEPLADLTAPLSALPASPPVAHKMPIVPVSPPPPPIASRGPKKETARIADIPEPKAAAPKIKMSKTQRLIIAPDPVRQSAPISIDAETSREIIESIPVPLCWALLGISALIFIIQLWTYLS